MRRYGEEAEASGQRGTRATAAGEGGAAQGAGAVLEEVCRDLRRRLWRWLAAGQPIHARLGLVAAIKRMAASDGDACPETEREGAVEHEGGSEKDGTSLPS